MTAVFAPMTSDDLIQRQWHNLLVGSRIKAVSISMDFDSFSRLLRMKLESEEGDDYIVTIRMPENHDGIRVGM